MTTSALVRTRSYAVALVRRSQRVHQQLSNQAALWALGLIAGLNALVYWWGFAQRLPLLAWQERAHLDLYKLARQGDDLRPQLISVYLALGLLYWLGWRTAQRAQGWAAWGIVSAGALAASAGLLWMYPIGAADIFDNILHGRVLGVHWHNPFVTPPATFTDDPFLAYAAWPRAPSAYGPGWEIPAALLAYALRDQSVAANLLAFKGLATFFFAAGVVIVARILRRWAPERALAGAVLLAWNPIILVETVGNGHNDMAMIVWVLAAVWALAAHRFTWATLLLLVGALVKFIPLLLLPVAMLLAVRDLPTWPRRLRFLVLSGLLGLLLVGLAYAPFWSGLATLTIDRRMKLFTTSLPATVLAVFSQAGASNSVGPTVAQLAAWMTASFALWQAGQAWRDRSWLSFPVAAWKILFFYLLFTCLWFQPWYAVWPLSLAAILPPGHAARMAALFGYAALSKQLFFEPLWLWSRPLPPKAWRELRLGPAVLAIPWLYLLGLWWVRRSSRTDSAPPHEQSEGDCVNPANVLITVAKRPAPGQTKTRLTPPLTPAQAALLYECFLRDTLDLMRQIPQVRRVIAFLPAAERAYFADLAPDFELVVQVGADLGARLDHALTYFLDQGCNQAVIMDSDSPTLPATTLRDAFGVLPGAADVVLGPCADGGYYLIGLKRPAPRLLRQVRMSTPQVTADTLALAEEEGLRVALLPTCYDIDEGPALVRLVQELATLPADIACHTRSFLADNLALVEQLQAQGSRNRV